MIFDFSGKRYNYTSWDGRRPIYKYIEALDRTVSSDLIKELKQWQWQRQQQGEGQKSNRFRLAKQQLNLHMQHFLYISLPSLPSYDMKLAKLIIVEDVCYKTMTFSFFS